ncbi:MAG: NADH-quinone oxidoreductase subunit J [Candidatus Omnitrophota bacterium]|jgi:NADH-quinone oxidoreductase subunit J|nr:MAG: NADH-quinone oxidoreductase subunit J [Candidatus Omnitrophota bacterium]
MLSAIFFWMFASAACFFAFGVILARNPMHSAVSLVATLIALAGLFLQLHAEFLAWILIIVYTGAVMVLIIFVISLLNLHREEPINLTLARRFGITFVGIFGFMIFVYLFTDSLTGFVYPKKLPAPEEFGSAASLAADLFTRYLLPFELASILLTAAVIGAVVIARKPCEEEEPKE